MMRTRWFPKTVSSGRKLRPSCGSIPRVEKRLEQQNFIDDAERRRVGTDAESERDDGSEGEAGGATQRPDGEAEVTEDFDGDRKSTRLNSSHGYISYAVFCLKKKK